MRIVIAAVGRPRDPDYRELLDGYYARVRRWATVDEVKLKDDGDDKVRAALDRLLAAVGARAELVVLDVEGVGLSSEGFARRLGATLDRAAVPVFLLGGAEGLPPDLRARAAWKLSLGPMTLPHRLARLVLAEQVYRAFTILKGEPYAREGPRD